MEAMGSRPRDEESDYNSDEDGIYGNEEIYGENGQRTFQEAKEWDLFRDPPIKEDSGSMEKQECLEFTIKIVKILAYIITFICVLGGAVISKGTLLFMTSQVKEKSAIPLCYRIFNDNKEYSATVPDVQRIGWMWGIFFVFLVPEVGTFLRSFRKVIFKTWEKPYFSHFLLVCTMETLHTIGLALFAYVILPNLDVVKGAMLTNCVCFIPALFGFLSRDMEKNKNVPSVFMDIIAILAQISGFIVWPLVNTETPILWAIPVATFCVSLGWWENYISAHSTIGIIKSMEKVKNHLHYNRYFTYLFISVWKMLVFFCSFLIIFSLTEDKLDVSYLFDEFDNAFGPHKIYINETEPEFSQTQIIPETVDVVQPGDTSYIDSSYNTVLYVFLIQMFTTYISYIFSKFACRIAIQGFSFAFPINLTIPVSISFLIAACGMKTHDPCAFYDVIPNYLFFNSPKVFELNNFMQIGWVWFFWLLSQIWITRHVWTPKCERLASTEKLFVTPMYNSFFIDQSLGMNRRRDDQKDIEYEMLPSVENDNQNIQADSHHEYTVNEKPKTTKLKAADHITRVYACATMWHETKDEMLGFLKSIFRLDEDQCARRLAQQYLDVIDPDYYEYETNIFLDDAFEISDHNDEDQQVNSFVKALVRVIDEAASEVHQTHIRIRPPKKYPTPYGGRLEWILPGKTKMICHLKDNSKIRNRKRWSQVMYMYYILGHRLMELPISVESKEARAENTYLLALDGDIDFQPSALTLLIDLMKKNKNLGAACGRIHPVGSGPMVWYQMFEYAIGHWLQKATEHTIGCVLCSPGCFSLFRGKALMDDNVMRKYTTTSEEARHYVQYDQGEDRWLCTLILQRGYRIEYSAASDAYTNSPEGFDEFYNQRRRWVPSTMANIFDLLADYKRIVKINDNISMPYIIYLGMLMFGTILGPGTIFLMLVGAFVAAFGISNWTSFLYNIFPILIFMIVCYTCKANIQLFFAKLISTIYGLVMMAVLVGLGLQIMEDGWFAPTTVFLLLIIFNMVVAALVHPQEIKCLLAIVVYYITVPSMYLLLIIYSLFNMNNVTWGTREVVTRKTVQQIEQEKKEAEELKKKAKSNTLLSFIGGGNNDKRGSFEFSCAGLFKCMFCTHPEGGEEKAQLLLINDSLEKLNKKVDHIERSMDIPEPTQNRRRSTVGGLQRNQLGPLSEDNENDHDNDSDSETLSTIPKEERDNLTNPYWIDDADLGKGETDFLLAPEIQFWTDLLAKYLFPLIEDKQEKNRIAQDLKGLRDRSVFAFFMINALFVLIVFLLQLNKDDLHIKWPLGVQVVITYDEGSHEIFIEREYLQLEPIGLVFVGFFATILIIQFFAMMFHRFGTLSHILAATELNLYCLKKADDMGQDSLRGKDAVAIVKELQKMDDDDGNKKNKGPDEVGRRKTVSNLKNTKVISESKTLDSAFRKNMKDEHVNKRLTVGKNTIKAFEFRRESIQVKRKSMKNNDITGLNQNGSGGIAVRSMRPSNVGIPPIQFNDINGGQINRAFDDDDTPVRKTRPSVSFAPQ